MLIVLQIANGDSITMILLFVTRLNEKSESIFCSYLYEKFFLCFERPIPVTQIAQLIGAKIIGEKEGAATGINEIHKVEEGDLVFVDYW